MTPEARIRIHSDQLLTQAGWHACDMKDANLHAAQGVAVCEFPLNPGYGVADYLLYVDGKACGVIETKKQGRTLIGAEPQSGRYSQGLPAALPAWHGPLLFLFESTGIETQFTNGLDQQPRSRPVFAFFRSELLAHWLLSAAPVTPQQIAPGTLPVNEEGPPYAPTGTFLTRMQHLPKLVTQWGEGGASYRLWLTEGYEGRRRYGNLFSLKYFVSHESLIFLC